MQLSIVGQSVPKVDVTEKTTGAAEYTGDISLKGKLVGKVLRSPHAHARILKIDDARARRLRGVKAVVTFADCPSVRWTSVGLPPSKITALTKDQFILTDRARHVGDAVAAVAAVDEDTACEAIDLISVEYEPLPAVFDPRAAMADDAPIIHRGKSNVMRFSERRVGSVEDGFKEADYVFEDTYVTPRSFQCSLEPCGVSLAAVDASGRLTVWTSTQMPHIVRAIIAEAVDLPAGRIRVIKPYVGGAFGSRLGVVNEPICALLAQVSRKPVMLSYSREETFLATECRHPIVMELKTGVKKDGTLTACRMRALIDGGAYATHTPTFVETFASGFMSRYKCPNTWSEVHGVYTNTPPCGAYRGYGNPQFVFATESQIDDIARTLNVDPLEMRLKNHRCKGDPYGSYAWPIESCGLEEAIERGAASIGWKQKRSERETLGQAKRRGIGMAFAMHSSGARPGLQEVSSAIIKLNEDGTANLIYSNTDSGQGSATVLTQIAAEEMGLRFEDVIITVTADTDTMPFDIGSHASRQTYSAGNAVRLAAGNVKRQMLSLASEILEVAQECLEIKDGQITVSGCAERSLSVSQLAHRAHFGDRGHQIIGVASAEPPANPRVYAAQFAEVEVDTETGVVSVARMVAAHDVGTAINPKAVEGQIEGAIQQGIGYALSEGYAIDRETGRPLHLNFRDYGMLTALDMPEVESIIVQAPSQSGPFGAKSVGESGLVATAAAIGNAIYDAVGVRLKEIPFTPEVVLLALREKGGEADGVDAETR